MAEEPNYVLDVFRRDISVKNPLFQIGEEVRTPDGSIVRIQSASPKASRRSCTWHYTTTNSVSFDEFPESHLRFERIADTTYRLRPGMDVHIRDGPRYETLAVHMNSERINLYLTTKERTRIYIMNIDRIFLKKITHGSQITPVTAEVTVETADRPERENSARQVYDAPAQIAEQLGRTVIGQVDAVRDVSIALFEHLRTAGNGHLKSNLLIIGPTGCGKTLLAREGSRLIDVPFSEIKVAGVSTTGYKGQNLSTVFLPLVGKPKGTVFLDELDKICGDRDGFFAEGLQQEIISWSESAKVMVGRTNENGSEREASIDTTEILFVGAGAFVGLDEIIARRIGTGRYEVERQELFANVMPEDLIQYGMKPELVGRFGIRTCVLPLTEVEMVRILKESDRSPALRQGEVMENLYGFTIEFDEQVYGLIARLAVESKVGARELDTVLGELLAPIKFDPRKYTQYMEGDTLHINTEIAKRHLAKRLQPAAPRRELIGLR